MSGRHPLLILGGWWLLAALIVAVGWCSLPAERQAEAHPTRLPVTVLPTATTFVFSAPSPPVASTPDLLPMRATSTRLPTRTSTPQPTTTPVPPTPDRPPVQRG